MNPVTASILIEKRSNVGLLASLQLLKEMKANQRRTCLGNDILLGIRLSSSTRCSLFDSL